MIYFFILEPFSNKQLQNKDGFTKHLPNSPGGWTGKNLDDHNSLGNQKKDTEKESSEIEHSCHYTPDLNLTNSTVQLENSTFCTKQMNNSISEPRSNVVKNDEMSKGTTSVASDLKGFIVKTT